MTSHLVCLCGTTIWMKESEFVMWLAFKIQYMVMESPRYLSPHCPDLLSENPLHALLPHKKKKREKDQCCSWSKSEWNLQFSRSNVFHDPCHWSYWDLHTSMCPWKSRTGCHISCTGGLQPGSGSSKAWFCYLAKLFQVFGLLIHNFWHRASELGST